MKCIARLLCYSLLLPTSSFAQEKQTHETCGTAKWLEKSFENNVILKENFKRQEQAFNSNLAKKTGHGKDARNLNTIAYIQVVFHVVMPNQALVTDAQIQAQLESLNRNFAGLNEDSINIPPHFKPLFAKSSIRFCLANQTPTGQPTTGIVRVATSQTQFDLDNRMKHASTGGSDSWDTDRYLNVWVCPFFGAGYATYPNTGLADEQGIVISYRALPGGSDFIDDTPNQGGPNFNQCYTGVKTDNCTTGGNGIMYQNYMDYSNDACLVMFTKKQVERMEAALMDYRSTLISSGSCSSTPPKNYDAKLTAIIRPDGRICEGSFTPVVTIQNKGAVTLTSLSISARIDNGAIVTTNLSGSIAYNQTTAINLNNLSTTYGNQILRVYVSNPNGVNDEFSENDTLSIPLLYAEPVQRITEGFESSNFPPPGWDVLNPNNEIGWQRTTTAAKTGVASVVIDNSISRLGEKDDLRLPVINLLSTHDSAFLSFQIAAAQYSYRTTLITIPDTLEIAVSADCGKTYSSLYKKWGAALFTTTDLPNDRFVPLLTQWRKDSINISPYIGKNNLLFTFRNITGNENCIYIDDVNVLAKNVDPNSRIENFLVTPNPTSGRMTVQIFDLPVLQTIQIFSTAGQKIEERIMNNSAAGSTYQFDLNRFAAGVYFVKAVFADRVITRKIVKL